MSKFIKLPGGQEKALVGGTGKEAVINKDSALAANIRMKASKLTQKSDADKESAAASGEMMSEAASHKD